tara:strand:- start:99 stop:863 length:765 start_codon:yes stop_codon:yes gene_type:complete
MTKIKLNKNEKITNDNWQSLDDFNLLLNEVVKLNSEDIKLSFQKANTAEKRIVDDFTSNFIADYEGIYKAYLKRWHYKNFVAKPTKETNITSLMLEWDIQNGFRDSEGNYLYDNVLMSKLANLINFFGFEKLIEKMEEYNIPSIPTAYDKKTLLGFPIDEDRKKTAQKAQQQRENNQKELQRLAEKGEVFENGTFIDLSKFVKKDKEGNIEVSNLPIFLEECIKLFIKDSDLNLDKALSYLKSNANKSKIKLVA